MTKQFIFDNTDSVVKAVADHIVKLSAQSILKHGKFTLALSGGNTPRKLYELLATAPYHKSIDWKHVFVFWGDERCLPASDPNNNSHMASEALLNNIAIPAENIFPVPVNFPPGRAATSYEQTLKTFFKDDLPVFDLVLLGLGDNGHTASLFPHSPILHEQNRIVKEVYVEDLKMSRISFTPLLINQARHLLFLVTGKEKAAIVKIVLSGKKDPDTYPAQLIKPEKGNTDWFLDKEAAAGLTIKK